LNGARLGDLNRKRVLPLRDPSDVDGLHRNDELKQSFGRRSLTVVSMLLGNQMCVLVSQIRGSN
jgi:hypothetical protein